MGKTDFDAFVKRQQAGKEEDSRFDPKQQLSEWLDYLDILYKQIQNYLQTYVKSGSMTIEFRDIQINEESIGIYSARQLILTIGRATVTFKPIGTMLIGMKGRVDVQGPSGAARLALVDKGITEVGQLVQITIIDPNNPRPTPPRKQAVERTEWTWKLFTPPPNQKFTELTQDIFFEMIIAVANA